MRTLALVLAAGACGYTPGHAGQASGDGGTMPDGHALDAKMLPDATPAVFALSGMQWVIPCTSSNGAPPTACAVAPTSPAYTTTIVLTGSASEHWLVTARIAGAVEGLTFTNGTADAQWYIGGDTGLDHGDNYYEIAVSSPAQHYFINNGSSGNPYSVAEDYTVQIPIDGNATVIFSASPQDGLQWQGIDNTSQPITISGVTAPPPNGNLYGQWAYFIVKSATLQ